MRFRALIIALVALATAVSVPMLAQEKSIVVASTTSTQDSGLFGHILPLFTAKTGIDVRVLAQGTGQALDTGRRGDADVESPSIRHPAAAGALVAARACRRPAALSMTLPDAPVRLGVSSCLLGERVRFDGGHKRDQFLVGLLGRFVEWVPVCPELESGMGSPREALRLTLRHTALRLVTAKTGQDQTAVMRQYARKRLDELAGERLFGFVLKKD